MMIIPAIDLMNGAVVRLTQGRYDQQLHYEQTPLELALAYEAAGARYLHVVDLDSAKGGGEANLASIKMLCQNLSIPVQSGGGVRSEHDIEARLSAGVARVVVGSVCIRTPDVFARWLEHWGSEALVGGLDVKWSDEQLAWVPHASGWTEPGPGDVHALIHSLMPHGLRHVLCTDIAKDGMLMGASNALYEELVTRYRELMIQASGGIGDEQDLVLAEATGVAGCIVGRALLEGRVSLDVLQPKGAE